MELIMHNSYKKIVSLCFVFSLLTFTQVNAENDPYYFGLSIGPAFEQLDETKASEHFNRTTSLNFDNSFGFQLRAGYVKNKYLTGEAILEYIFPFDADNARESVEFDVLHIAIQSKLTIQQSGPVLPYALIGLGLMNAQMKSKINFDNSSIQENEWGLSTKLGAGIDIYITPNIFSHLELNWTKGLGNVDHIQYPAFMLGGNYRF
jgi:opacity protein-like surface antigen